MVAHFQPWRVGILKRGKRNGSRSHGGSPLPSRFSKGNPEKVTVAQKWLICETCVHHMYVFQSAFARLYAHAASTRIAFFAGTAMGFTPPQLQDTCQYQMLFSTASKTFLVFGCRLYWVFPFTGSRLYLVFGGLFVPRIWLLTAC